MYRSIQHQTVTQWSRSWSWFKTKTKTKKTRPIPKPRPWNLFTFLPRTWPRL